MKAITAEQAMKLTPMQVEERRVKILESKLGWEMKMLRDAGYELLHWSELTYRPAEYWEFHWVLKGQH